MQRKGILYVISGPSGAGKGTVLAEVFKKVKDLHFSVSATNRAPRANEIDGVNYHFITDEQFDKLIEEDGLLEYVSKYGNRYGTVKSEVEKMIEECKDVVLEIETTGASNVKRMLKKRVVSIFIAPPSMAELRARLEGRASEGNSNRELRFNTSIHEMMCAYYYDYIVVNDNLNDCVEKVVNIIEGERCKVKYNRHLIKEILNKK
ncbi:MAG: guanylate kinase [Clostridiales bacterium]|nr:guanylate kinase [Clostridiales bacterium]